MKSESEIKYNNKIPVSKIKDITKIKDHIFSPNFDMKICKKSHDCYVFCPRDAIEIQKTGIPKVNMDLCDGCLICLRVCPFSAVGEKHEK